MYPVKYDADNELLAHEELNEVVAIVEIDAVPYNDAVTPFVTNKDPDTIALFLLIIPVLATNSFISHKYLHNNLIVQLVYKIVLNVT